MKTSSNWIHSDKPILSLNDKVKELIKIGHKLVLCQLHELERIRLSTHTDRHANFIGYLYDNYITNNLTKTYLQ